MVTIINPIGIAFKAVRAFFTADVHVRRGDHGITVVLDDPIENQRREREARARAAANEKEQLELKSIRRSLKALLDEHAANRKAMRHLAYMEHAIKKRGLAALQQVPYDLLKQALDQFERLVLNWSDEGLALLRSKMAVTLMQREPAPSTIAMDDPPSESVSPASLAHPETLQGDEAAEAEAALRAAYGEVVLPPLQLSEPAPPSMAVEMHGELDSPSAKALQRAARLADSVAPPQPA